VADIKDFLNCGSILEDVYKFLDRFIAYPSEHALIAHALWCLHTHCMDAWDTTPRIAFLSPEPGSGKTRALEVTELLCPGAVQNCNVSTSYLFRKVGAVESDGPVTILFDETDAVFHARSESSEQIRGILNAGYRRGATVGRTVMVGKLAETHDTPVFAPVALAGLGHLPHTLMTRSIVIHMKRRGPTETVEPFRTRDHRAEGHEIRDRIALWASKATDRLSKARPTMPAEISDRAADCWEPLFAIADMAGQEWGAKAREAAVALLRSSKLGAGSMGIRLLADCKAVLKDWIAESVPTQELLNRLLGLPDSVWVTLKRGPLDSAKLAKWLAPYDIRPEVIRIGERTHRGYHLTDFEDAWVRYVPTEEKEATKGEARSAS
jgi:Protein of unknown function (DUF3631)